MAFRYTPEQLVRLRSSSLVRRPESLPPLEDWMGPPADQKQKGFAQLRGKPDEQAHQGEITPRRPNLLDTHHASKKSSSTAPEDIVLGPPKTAFASANPRNALKSLSGDTSEGAPASNNRAPTQERSSKDHEVVDGERREGRYSGISSRRPGKDERDSWQSGRRRHPDEDQGDGRHRRNGDPKMGRWDKEQEAGGDPKRLSRDAARREGRGKFEQPWFRGDKVQEAESGSRSTNKPHDWRNNRGSGRGPEGDRSAKIEQDPEWMDSAVASEPKQAHTQEEFQRWKESMKASEEGPPKPSEKQEKVQEREFKQPEPPPMPAFLDSSTVDLSMDKFFAAYSDPRVSSEQKPQETKAHRKPRFAALFTPQAEATPKDPPTVTESSNMNQPSALPEPQSASGPGDANKADQEHFQRVLQMLAGRSSNSRPQTADPSKPPDDSSRGELPPVGREPKSSLAESFLQRDTIDVRGRAASTEGSKGVFESLASRNPEIRQQSPQQPTPKKDTDLLLRLMQQSALASESRSPQPSAGASLFPAGFSQQSQAEKVNSNLPPFFDDPAISKTQRPEPVQPRNSQQRRPTNGPPSAFFDEPFFANLRQSNQKATPKIESGSHIRPPSLPSGISRPPGFEQMMSPPPGWQPQVAHRQVPPLQQPPLSVNPPPGIPHHIGNPVYGPSAGSTSGLALPLRPSNHIASPTHIHQPQMPRPQYQQHPQILRQSKYAADNLGGSGLPLPPGPGGPPPGPPPGFRNLNGLPPPLGLPPGVMGLPPNIGPGAGSGALSPLSQLPPHYLDGAGAGNNMGRMGVPRPRHQITDRPD